MTFTGKRVLITGSAAGIGRAMALRFTTFGARVAGLDIDPAANRETAELTGESFLAVTGDAASLTDARHAVETLGGVDVLINNAGSFAGDGALHEVSEDAWDRTIEVCLKSMYACTRAVLPGMMAQRAGVIVSISSVNALSGIHLSAYSAAKGGMISLSRLLAAHYGGLGIRSNVICPGTIATEAFQSAWEKNPNLSRELEALYPAGRFGAPEDVASCACWLASDEARFVNGATLVVDGGMSAVHRLLSILPHAKF
jgi:3-oxoacyl-[acyl-carrier protein] reductase